MKINKTKISHEDLVYQYLPADYSDAYMCDFEYDDNITADDVQISFWTDFPRWVRGLFKLRDFLVKPFGIQAGILSESEKENAIKSIRQGMKPILCKSEDETVFHADDKHLEFYLSAKVTVLNNKKNIKAVTLVKVHNWLGRVYFFFIYPFHRIVVKASLKRFLSTLSQRTVTN